MIPNLYLFAGAAAVSAAVAFGAGWKVQGWRKDAAITEMVTQANALLDEREKLLDHLEKERELSEQIAAEAAVAREAETKIVTEYIDREVIKYVQTPAANDCGLDPEWVRIHDRAALNTDRLPEAEDAATEPDAGASKAEALAGVTDNYATCHEVRDQLSALQDWVRAGL